MMPKQGHLFIAAKSGDTIKIGSTTISIIEVDGRVKLCIEADRKISVEYIPKIKVPAHV